MTGCSLRMDIASVVCLHAPGSGLAGGGALFPGRFFPETPQSLVNAWEWGSCRLPPSWSLWSPETEVSDLEPDMALASSSVLGWEQQFWDWQCGWRVSVQHGRSRVSSHHLGWQSLQRLLLYSFAVWLTNLPHFPQPPLSPPSLHGALPSSIPVLQRRRKSCTLPVWGRIKEQSQIKWLALQGRGSSQIFGFNLDPN